MKYVHMEPTMMDVYRYLSMLRKSGKTNRFGDTVDFVMLADDIFPYLEDAFNMSSQEAENALVEWTHSFDLPKDKQPQDGR
jgi:hypothetical protein